MGAARTSPSSLPRNPISFSDFSLHVGQDAEMDLEPCKASYSSQDRPRSMDSQASSLDSRSSSGADYMSRFAERRWGTSAGSAPVSQSMAIPKGRYSLHQHSMPLMSQTSSPAPTVRRKQQEGKIEGMDYYEFCELIRSSSL
ncbi:hypothetical protein WJX72_002921 [[Myrmecia] bisecta]|uniref:Uncharacterized protein n=1 Tax=[Myrmecia] bisecta TaxID=41462 RepID=A0AAW1R590_9CHLO